MARRIALILGAIGLAANGAGAQTPPTEAGEPVAEIKSLVDSCPGRKFETIVAVGIDRRGKKVTICGKAGQTDAEWINTLRSSVAQAEANESLAEPVKEQIIAALNAEIERVGKLAAAPAAAPPVAAIAIAPEPVTAKEPAPQYSALPPLPAPKPKATVAAAASTAPPVARPRLTISCALPRESFGPCDRLERETQLLIRADEDLADGASLRFLRGGDERAELDLGALRKGMTMRQKLPGRVCSGVLRGKVQVQILSHSKVAETLGPYALYCGA
jgi:hypothetical protein